MEIFSDVHLFLNTLFRGLLVVGVALSIGSLGFYWSVFKPALSSMGREKSVLLHRRGELWVRRLVVLAVFLLVAANLIALVHEASMMSGMPVARVFPILPAVLTGTHWGMVWIARTVLLAIIVLILLVRFSVPLTLLFSTGVAVTISLMSHAVDAGNLSLPLAADALHLTSISFWIGGLVPLRYLTGGILKTLDDPEERRRFLYESLRRFSRIATVAVIMALLTGLYNAWLHLPDFASAFALMTRSSWAEILRIKHVFAIVTIALGGVSRFIVLPGLKRAGSEERLLRLFYAAIALELILAAITLSCAFLLTQEMPLPIRRIYFW